MAVKIEGVPVIKAKLVLDSNPRISPLELSYFLLLDGLRSNSRIYQWASKYFQMIRFLDAERMPRAICLWEIKGEFIQLIELIQLFRRYWYEIVMNCQSVLVWRIQERC